MQVADPVSANSFRRLVLFGAFAAAVLTWATFLATWWFFEGTFGSLGPLYASPGAVVTPDDGSARCLGAWSRWPDEAHSLNANQALVVSTSSNWGTKVNGPACAPGQRMRRALAGVSAIGILTFLVRRASMYAQVRELSKVRALLVTALSYLAMIVVAAAVPLIIFIAVMALPGV